MAPPRFVSFRFHEGCADSIFNVNEISSVALAETKSSESKTGDKERNIVLNIRYQGTHMNINYGTDKERAALAIDNLKEVLNCEKIDLTKKKLS